MIKKNTLRSIVTENWDSIAKALELNIENKPENMFLFFRHFQPILESGAAVFPRPERGTYSPVQEVYKKDVLLLKQMGFVTDKNYYDWYGLTDNGIDLINCYHKSKNQDFHTNDELVADIIKLCDHLYEK